MDEPWFRPKRYGYGAGRPIHPLGWLLLVTQFLTMLLVAIAAVTLVPRLFPSVPPALVLIPLVLAVSIPFALIARAKTQGGWRWRSGRD